MAIPFAHHINMQGLQLLNFVVHPSGTSPSAPSGGQMWWENDTWRLNVYDDSSLAWKRLVMGPSGATTIGNLVTWAENDGSELSAISYGIANDLNASAPATSVARADAAKIYSDSYIANEAVGFTTPGAPEDGYSIQWQNSTSEWIVGPVGVGVHDMLSASHDATTHTAVQGDMIYSDVAANWDALTAGSINQYLRMGATIPGWGGLDIVHDTTPTLGGPLDADDYNIDNVDSLTFLDGIGDIRTNTTASNIIRFQAYDTDLPGYITFASLTAGTTPTFDLSTSTTIGSNNIAYEGGAFHDTFSDYVANEHLDLSTITITLTETANETTVTNSGVPYDLTTSRSWVVGLPDNVTIAGNLTTSALYATNVNVANINAYDETAAISITNVTGDVTILNTLRVDEGIQYYTGYTPVTEPEGLVWWNDDHKTLNISTGMGPVLQVGQERYLKVYNNTGGILYDGQIVATDGTLTNGIPNVILARADSFSTCFSISMLTQDIANGAWGFATRDGSVHGIDTSLLSTGPLFLSPTVAGAGTSVQPSFPDYTMIIGGVTVSDPDEGVVVVSRYGKPGDTIYNFWNGIFRESFAFTVSSAGGVVTGTLTPTNGNVDMTAMFSDGLAIVDTSPPATVVLTAGTDDVPQMNYIYVPQSTKVLTVSTSDWPVAEHIRVATVYLRSATTTITEDALKVHNWNDHIQAPSGQGHLSHLGQKLRKFEAQWESGCELTAVLRTVPSPDELYVTVTGGSVFQMHPQAIDPFDTEASDIIHVWNHFTTPFLTIQDLATQTADSTDTTLSNKHYSVVIWGSASSAGEPGHLFMNLPSGSYNSASLALADPNNYALYIIPPEFSGTGYLIARLVLQFSGGTNNMTVTATEDLRGKIPNTSAGGGSIGGAGATTHLALTDTPATFASAGLMAVRVNTGESALEYTSALNLDTITEWTTNAGVTIETIELKDGDLTAPGTISSTSATTGQSTIGYGLIVNDLSSGLAIADFQVNTLTYNALFVDASNDSIVMMSSALGKIGFFGATATVQSTGWTVTNHIADKIINADATTIDEIVDVLGELITELKLKGILGG